MITKDPYWNNFQTYHVKVCPKLEQIFLLTLKFDISIQLGHLNLNLTLPILSTVILFFQTHINKLKNTKKLPTRSKQRNISQISFTK
jgi:hypothetical protein